MNAKLQHRRHNYNQLDTKKEQHLQMCVPHGNLYMFRPCGNASNRQNKFQTCTNYENLEMMEKTGKLLQLSTSTTFQKILDWKIVPKIAFLFESEPTSFHSRLTAPFLAWPRPSTATQQYVRSQQAWNTVALRSGAITCLCRLHTHCKRDHGVDRNYYWLVVVRFKFKSWLITANHVYIYIYIFDICLKKIM